jgi:catechol 2,3-dioxygenase-like lactoylglutathione lyase family enzyme
MARLEHINISVQDPDHTAQVLHQLFGWQVQWAGPAMQTGYTVHVGDGAQYLALYRHGSEGPQGQATRYEKRGGLNHIGVVVDDLRGTEAKVREAGYQPHSHADYEPGQRFYFDGPDGVEYEIVSYA